jgi:predicted nucleic acid-binding protein
MESARIVIDTSIVIEHLRKHNKRKSILYNLPDEYALYSTHPG